MLLRGITVGQAGEAAGVVQARHSREDTLTNSVLQLIAEVKLAMLGRLAGEGDAAAAPLPVAAAAPSEGLVTAIGDESTGMKLAGMPTCGVRPWTTGSAADMRGQWMR